MYLSIDIFLALCDQLSLQRETAMLDMEIHLTDEMHYSFEKHVCRMDGEKRIEDIDDARSKIFWNKMRKENKAVDISLLSQCKNSLRKHTKRTNYMARISRKAATPVMSLDDPKYHGWLPDLTID